MGSFFARELRVEWGQCDPAGIVFAPRFFDMFSENAVQIFEAAGLPAKRDLLAETGAAGIPLVSLTAQFHRPVTYGNIISVESARPVLGTSSMKLEHRIMCAGQLCISASETRVWVASNEAGDIRPAVIPEFIKAAFEVASGDMN
ncbi:acyl-CoA thioesterase [Sphingobium limneticum]|jgi:4-hydroxybenzoyl-CoA thioesterase|uniref:acyl-CoA thioesterase n=1 Tax=Sphingobium limneticum TaxID=1007511 RepID=UPI003D0769FF